MAEVSPDFVKQLQEYDSQLSAWRDSNPVDCIHIVRRHGAIEQLVFSVDREHGEMWPELERRIISIELPKRDIWKRYSSAKEYDDALANKEAEFRKSKEKEIKNNRLERLKDEVDRSLHALKP